MAFRDVVGHQGPLQIIRRAITAQRVHHTYLFTGMDGIGKRLVALNMAKALNCADQTDEACDHCPACQRIAKGVHPDLILINPVGETIKIGQIRELQQSLALKPFEARWRVIIVDGAERMTREAANALLKTLEEPPPWTIIILSATTIEALPATVLSRCQRIRFNPLSRGEVAEVLVDHLPAERIDIVAPLAGGSPGRALRIDWEELTKAKGALSAVLSPSLTQRLRVAQELAHEEERGRMLLEILGSWFRDLIVYQETGEKGMLLNHDLVDEIKRDAANRKIEGLLQDFWSLLQIQQGLEAHGNLQLSLESALVGIGGA